VTHHGDAILHTRRLLLALVLAGVSLGTGAAGELAWTRRSLRAPSPEGYLAVVHLAAAEGGLAATLACEGEGAELRAEGRRWTVAVDGRQVADGALPQNAPATLFAKRTRTALVLGAAGRWLHAHPCGEPKGRPAVRVGVPEGRRIASCRLVAREPVRFADDFPDPEPTAGRWVPVAGRWALSSLAYATQSANPAELAAVFDEPEDTASEGRTRTVEIGVGLRLTGWPPRVWQVAAGSPADHAGIRADDVVYAVDGATVGSTDAATRLLAGDAGETVKLTLEREGRSREVELERTLVAWGTIHRLVDLHPCKPADEALIAAGEDYWTDYRFAAAVHTRGAGAFGLVFAYQGPRDYHAFRWLGADLPREGLGRAQLVRVRAGHATVLAEHQGGFRPHDFYAMSVVLDGDAPGQVRARGFVHDTLLVEARDDAIVPGRLGFWAQAPGTVCFDDVAVGIGPARHDPSQGTANVHQRYDRVMRVWADPAYSWHTAEAEDAAWHLADFPGTVSLTTAVRRGESIELEIAAQRGSAGSGYTLALGPDASGIQLKRAGRIVARSPASARDGQTLTITRTAGNVTARLDGQTLLSWHDPQPLRGAAVRVRGVPVAAVRLQSPNVFEDYFNGAPSGWHAMGGSWEVMNRWVCKPTWSFFGGRSNGLLALWSRRRMDGDAFLDAYVGVMMLTRDAPMRGYENMRDLGLTLCGNGRDMASGYTAIIGAQHNTLTALYRNGQLVASTRDRDALLPRIPMGGFGNEAEQHRSWSHVKLARQGRRIRLFLRDDVVLDYEDPEPIAGGHAGVWTVDSGLLLAKVRLAADRLGPPAPFFRQAAPYADAALTNDCGDAQTRVTATDGTYELVNTTGGGTFAIALRPRLCSAVQRPILSFDARLTPDAKIDFYFRCRGILHRIVLTGPASDPPGVETLGTFPDVRADGTWQTFRFDLLAALRRKYPDDKLLMVWRPEFANHSNADYLLAGFGGNPAGATYWLRGISLAPASPDRPSSRATASALPSR